MLVATRSSSPYQPPTVLPSQLLSTESPEGRRTAVVVLKERSTPSRYPRKPGVPGKKPL